MLPKPHSHADLLASARILQSAWDHEVTLLLYALITPRDTARERDLDHMADALEEAALGLERLEGIRLAICETVKYLRVTDS